MTPEFEKSLNVKLTQWSNWANENSFTKCRLVQYSGVELVGALDVPLDEIETQIKGLITEGFYVDWKPQGQIAYLRVYEYGGPEPDWKKTFAEKNLGNKWLLNLSEHLRMKWIADLGKKL